MADLWARSAKAQVHKRSLCKRNPFKYQDTNTLWLEKIFLGRKVQVYFLFLFFLLQSVLQCPAVVIAFQKKLMKMFEWSYCIVLFLDTHHFKRWWPAPKSICRKIPGYYIISPPCKPDSRNKKQKTKPRIFHPASALWSLTRNKVKANVSRNTSILNMKYVVWNRRWSEETLLWYKLRTGDGCCRRRKRRERERGLDFDCIRHERTKTTFSFSCRRSLTGLLLRAFVATLGRQLQTPIKGLTWS